MSERVKGLYISTDGKIDRDNHKKGSRYVIGTKKQFNELLTNGKMNAKEEYLNKDYRILYNSQSKEPRNEKVNKYVENTDICGPVIIIKKSGSLESNDHKKLQKFFKGIDWLGFDLDFG